jgi:nucleoside 2-deoxyribosyltransferase
MKSVVLCGSKRFKPEIRKFAEVLKKKGVVVYEPFLRSGEEGDWNSLSEYDKRFVALGLTHDHFYKIRMADVVYVYNKNGYSGVSTTMEIAYAAACGKPIYAYSDKDDEYCRKVFFREIINTPNALIKRLN